MKKIKNYSAPLCEVRRNRLRSSILAGSQVIEGHDMEWGARQRTVTAPQEQAEKSPLFEF